MWIKTLILILFSLLQFSVNSKTLYVSLNGLDSNTGTIDFPLKTIQLAISKSTEGDTIFLRKGEYFQTFNFISKKNIYFSSYQGEKVTINNTTKTTNWIIEDDNIYSMKTNDSVIQLFLNKQPKFTASYPNIKEGNFDTTNWLNTLNNPDKSITLPENNNINVLNSYYVGLHSDRLIGISGLVSNFYNNTAILENDQWYWNIQTYIGRGIGYFTGKKEFLDSDGEWIYEKGKFYIYLKNNSDTGSYFVRTKKNAIKIDSCNGITINSIDLFAGAISILNSSYINIQNSNFRYITPFFRFENGFEIFSPKKGVDSENPENWNGKGADFSKYDGPETWHGNGIEISGENNTIQNCYIAHSWGDGITVWGKGHKIINNVITDCNWIGIDCAPLNISGSDHLIQYNEISYAGRSVLLHRFLESSKILNNHIHHGGILCNDQGLTYTFWTDGKGTEIAYNYLHDNLAKKNQVGIYLDNWTYNYEIHHNIVNNSGTGITINKPHNNHKIYNNTLFGNVYSMGCWGPEGTTVRNIKTFNNLTNTDKKEKWNFDSFYGNEIKSNYVFKDNNLFVDPKNHDFRLKKYSYGIDLGIIYLNKTEYNGVYPDLGAIEFNSIPWKYGSSLFIPNEDFYKPKPPINLTLVKNTSDTTLFKWEYPFGEVDTFYIERKISTGIFETIAKIHSSKLEYNDSLQPLGEYRYQIRAKNKYGLSEPSNSFEIFNPLTIKSYFFDAENYDLQDGTNIANDLLINNDNKDFIVFKEIDFLNDTLDACLINMAVPCEYSWQEIQLRLDKPMGRMIGKMITTNTGGWDKFEIKSFPIEKIVGKHDIYLNFKGSYGVGSIDWFYLYNSKGKIKEEILVDSTCKYPTLKNRKIEITIFPNPYTSNFTVSLDNKEYSEISVSVFDINGYEFYKNQFSNVSPGTFEIYLNDYDEIKKLEAGVYFIKIDLKSKNILNSQILKLIKTNE